MTPDVSPKKFVSIKPNHIQKPCKYIPGLYVLATPIGNLKDISIRALETLENVDLIACEDTRHSHILLKTYGIKTPSCSFHDYSSPQKLAQLIQRMQEGQRIAFISDAGTPGISDPGYELIQACLEHFIYVTHIPGACAHVMALILSGLPPHPYYFQGFLPQKQKDRQDLLTSLTGLRATLLFYEAPHRLQATLEDLHAIFGDRKAAIARELTKLHEIIHMGTLTELIAPVTIKKLKGECVIVVAPAPKETYSHEDIEGLIQETLLHYSVNETAKKVGALTGLPKTEIYQRALLQKNDE